MSDRTTLTFARARGGRLHVGPEAVAALRSHRQCSPGDSEAGGILLGRYLLDSPDVVIDHVSEPMPGDRRTRTSFHRHHKGHQALIDQAWAESGGRCAWLGEWHTHPEPVPSPSWVDRRDWRGRLKRDVFDEALFFLIVGTDATCAWEGTPPRRLHSLTPSTHARDIGSEPRHVLEEAGDAEASPHPRAHSA